MLKKIYSISATILILIGLTILFSLIVSHDAKKNMIYHSLIFISYFTVVSNISILIFFISEFFNFNLFRSTKSRTIIEANILFTCVIYYSMLITKVQYEGILDLISAQILHLAAPMLCIYLK